MSRAWVRDRTAARRRPPLQPAAPVAAPAPTAAPAVDEVLAAVTAVVAEMTGYPAELLEPDLDLEADLGVDTVKQAEVFAAVRERYGVERDENLQLRDFPTLRHVASLGARPRRPRRPYISSGFDRRPACDARRGGASSTRRGARRLRRRRRTAAPRPGPVTAARRRRLPAHRCRTRRRPSRGDARRRRRRRRPGEATHQGRCNTARTVARCGHRRPAHHVGGVARGGPDHRGLLARSTRRRRRPR